MYCRINRLIVVAIVVKRISNADLSSIESFWDLISVDDLNRNHFMGFVQIQLPPGVHVVVCMTAGPLVPVAGTIPISGIICNAK